MKPLPPQSPGLPPSGIRNEQAPRDAHRRKHPARRGPIPLKDTAAIIETVVSQMDTKAPEALAAQTKRDISLVRQTIREARKTMQERVDEYVDLHLLATKNAADKGDARPAEWALERIEEDGERVVSPPAAQAPTAMPTLAIGIALGGIPQTVQALPPAQKALEGEMTPSA